MIARFSSSDPRDCDAWLESMGARLESPTESAVIGWVDCRQGTWHAACLTGREADDERVGQTANAMLAAD
jgi:hypothetical protein